LEATKLADRAAITANGTTYDLARFGPVMVWSALALFALAKSVVHLLTEIGAANPIDGRNPISFCNVLFVGNLIAAATLFFINRKDWTRDNFAKLSRHDWVSIVVIGIMSGALAPTFGFLALESTSVSNVVFLGRVEPILFMFLSAVILKDRPDSWALLGAAVSAVGVFLILYLQGMETGGFMLGKGEIFAILTAITLACGTIISKVRLGTIPFGIFAVLRMVIGAVIYFCWAYYWFGPAHFLDVFSPVLWQWMLLYGAIIVAGGQFLFLKGIANSRSQDVSLAASFSPLIAITFAFLLLGEVPDRPIIVGGSIICFGIFLAQAGSWYSRRREERKDNADVIEIEGRVTFRGV
jgi:drug/metabolite transporter (DMT)-like permease